MRIPLWQSLEEAIAIRCPEKSLYEPGGVIHSVYLEPRWTGSSDLKP